MNQGRIIVITGAPGTGKTTTASAVAKESDLEKSVHMHTDDFYHYLSKGAIPPHLPESNEQNLIVIEAFLEAAKRYARGGYDVIVDGIVGPWFLEPWLNIVQEHYEVHYIVLRASKEETMKRAIERSKLDRETNIELVETMWKQFSNLGIYELNVIDTTTHSIKDTVSAVKEKYDTETSFADRRSESGASEAIPEELDEQLLNTNKLVQMYNENFFSENTLVVYSYFNESPDPYVSSAAEYRGDCLTLCFEYIAQPVATGGGAVYVHEYFTLAKTALTEASVNVEITDISVTGWIY